MKKKSPPRDLPSTDQPAKKASQPHDSLFKAAMRDPKVARDVIKANIPKFLDEMVLWNTLRLQNTNFVRDNLEQLHSDVVYLCQLNEGSYLYFIIEHQSTPDKTLAFRMKKYNLQLTEQHMAQGHEYYPHIVNICIYAGETSPYPHSLVFEEFFKNTRLAHRLKLKLKPIYLGDLTILSEEGLKTYGEGEELCQILNQGLKREFLTWLKERPEFLGRILERSYKTNGLAYILQKEESYSADELLKAIITLAPKQESIIMSAAQQLEERGMQRGMERGMERERLDIARSMLTKGYATKEVTALTGLSGEDIRSMGIGLN